MTTEKWVVIGVDIDVAGYDQMPMFDTEAEAVAAAVDSIAEIRQSEWVEKFGWDSHMVACATQVMVAKVMYRGRRCDEQDATPKDKKRGFEFSCDYQLFPLEEDDDE